MVVHDYLTCGGCQGEFLLEHIVQFVDHKKTDCDDLARTGSIRMNSVNRPSLLRTSDDPPYSCQWCPEQFWAAVSMMGHAQGMHDLSIFKTSAGSETRTLKAKKVRLEEVSSNEDEPMSERAQSLSFDAEENAPSNEPEDKDGDNRKCCAAVVPKKRQLHIQSSHILEGDTNGPKMFKEEDHDDADDDDDEDEEDNTDTIELRVTTEGGGGNRGGDRQGIDGNPGVGKDMGNLSLERFDDRMIVSIGERRTSEGDRLRHENDTDTSSSRTTQSPSPQPMGIYIDVGNSKGGGSKESASSGSVSEVSLSQNFPCSVGVSATTNCSVGFTPVTSGIPLLLNANTTYCFPMPAPALAPWTFPPPLLLPAPLPVEGAAAAVPNALGIVAEPLPMVPGAFNQLPSAAAGEAGSSNTTSSSGRKKKVYPTTRPFKCDDCMDSFNQRVHLRKHSSKHTGIKPFKCNECDYATVEKSHLKVHIRIHTGEKPFKCTHCEYATAQNSTLKIHLKRRHSDALVLSCSVCGKHFPEQDELSNHEREHGTLLGSTNEQRAFPVGLPSFSQIPISGVIEDDTPKEAQRSHGNTENESSNTSNDERERSALQSSTSEQRALPAGLPSFNHISSSADMEDDAPTETHRSGGNTENENINKPG